MEVPYFSIIIPTYNSGQTLSRCLTSIVRQRFKDFEVVIVDGNSSADDLSIVKQYANLHPNIRWVSEKDNGIYDAMNKGISLAKGEWLYFIGSDDSFHNDCVLASIFSMKKHKYDVVYGNVRVIGNSSWANDGDVYDGEFDFKKLKRRNICQQAIFYNKRCFRAGEPSFDTSYKVCADWDFNFRCWTRKPFLYTDIVVADFSAGGASAQTTREITREIRDLRLRFNAYRDLRATCRSLYNKCLSLMRLNKPTRSPMS